MCAHLRSGEQLLRLVSRVGWPHYTNSRRSVSSPRSMSVYFVRTSGLVVVVVAGAARSSATF